MVQNSNLKSQVQLLTALSATHVDEFIQGQIQMRPLWKGMEETGLNFAGWWTKYLSAGRLHDSLD